MDKLCSIFKLQQVPAVAVLFHFYAFFYQRNARGGTWWPSVNEETKYQHSFIANFRISLTHSMAVWTEQPHVEECSNLYGVQI
jgi:hypothetical protein